MSASDAKKKKTWKSACMIEMRLWHERMDIK